MENIEKFYYSCTPCMRPLILQWKSGFKNGVNLVVFYYIDKGSEIWRDKRDGLWFEDQYKGDHYAYKLDHFMVHLVVGICGIFVFTLLCSLSPSASIISFSHFNLFLKNYWSKFLQWLKWTKIVFSQEQTSLWNGN